MFSYRGQWSWQYNILINWFARHLHILMQMMNVVISLNSIRLNIFHIIGDPPILGEIFRCMNDNIPGDGGPADDSMQTGWCLHTNNIYTVLILKTSNGIELYGQFLNCFVLS